MVRQWVLVPPFGGSNPSAPAKLLTKYAKYGVIFCYVDDGKAESEIFQLLKKMLDILAVLIGVVATTERV